jgi:hypothetical protein
MIEIHCSYLTHHLLTCSDLLTMHPPHILSIEPCAVILSGAKLVIRAAGQKFSKRRKGGRMTSLILPALFPTTPRMMVVWNQQNAGRIIPRLID